MRVDNEDCSPVGIHGRDTSATPIKKAGRSRARAKRREIIKLAEKLIDMLDPRILYKRQWRTKKSDGHYLKLRERKVATRAEAGWPRWCTVPATVLD
jgi:hypothetical protein